jgi:hypothetical protein
LNNILVISLSSAIQEGERHYWHDPQRLTGFCADFFCPPSQVDAPNFRSANYYYALPIPIG